jgi:hypothetical protein
MFNHARTLLMNVSGSSGFFSGYPGEELIPPSYNAITLPTYLSSIRMRMFGADPDRVMLNYRVAQLLTLIESTELQQYVVALDPRLTYTGTANRLASKSLFVPSISQQNGSAQLTLIGEPLSPDASGHSAYSYRVELSGGNAIVTRNTFPSVEEVTPVVLTSGLSQEISLPLSGYRFRVNASSNAAWNINGFFRPTLDLTAVARGFQSLGEPYLLQLFGSASVEPYTTFQNCWKTHPDFAYRLSGFVLALIYRTEELRNA